MNRVDRTRSVAAFPGVYVLAALLAATTVSAQDSKEAAMPPNDLVRATVKNEVQAANNTAVKFSFRSRKQSPGGVENKIYIEANEALATMTVSEGDQPLSPEKEHAEIEQLAQLVNHPDRLRKKQEHEKLEVEHTLNIVRALPDAFCYEYAGTEKGAPGLGKPGDTLVKLKFKPNPSFVPPSRVEQVLQGMEGFLLIDANEKRIARIDGSLFKEVTFGWGIFGRLDQGGHFKVQQTDAGDGNWTVSEMDLKFTGKILLIKSLNIVSDEIFTDFQRLPGDLPFARAVEMLQIEHNKIAQEFHAPQTVETSRNSH
jgi:hypothetical protein